MNRLFFSEGYNDGLEGIDPRAQMFTESDELYNEYLEGYYEAQEKRHERIIDGSISDESFSWALDHQEISE